MSTLNLQTTVDARPILSLVIAKPMLKAVKISGRKLAILRRRLFIGQEELARALGISKGRMTAIEKADEAGMHASNFRKLAEILKMSPDTLAQEIGPGKPAGLIKLDVPQDVYNGLLVRAELEGLTLDEWFVRHASLAVEVHDVDPRTQDQSEESPESRSAKRKRPGK